MRTGSGSRRPDAACVGAGSSANLTSPMTGSSTSTGRLQPGPLAGLGLEHVTRALADCRVLGPAGAVRDVLGAVDVGLVDRDDDPALRRLLDVVAGGQRRREREPVEQRRERLDRTVLDDRRLAVDVQADGDLEEVHEEQADVAVLGDVAHRRHHAIALVLGPHDGPLVDHAHEPGGAGAERAVALAMGVRRGDERHRHPLDELAHQRRQVIEHLVVVEGVGTLGRAELLLQLVLARGTGTTVRPLIGRPPPGGSRTRS